MLTFELRMKCASYHVELDHSFYFVDGRSYVNMHFPQNTYCGAHKMPLDHEVIALEKI
jgi:hypothetical protein